eukprot:4036579-Amphidinium_carterae.2
MSGLSTKQEQHQLHSRLEGRLTSIACTGFDTYEDLIIIPVLLTCSNKPLSTRGRVEYTQASRFWCSVHSVTESIVWHLMICEKIMSAKQQASSIVFSDVAVLLVRARERLVSSYTKAQDLLLFYTKLQGHP